jgi:predicted RecA/RadA family phage recombinase
MASEIVKDGHLPAFVSEVEVPAETKTNDFVIVGAKRGLAGFDARQSEDDGKWYTTIDRIAWIVFHGFAGAVTDGQPVYMTDAKAVTLTASGNTKIGVAERAKPAAAGDLHVRLAV